MLLFRGVCTLSHSFLYLICCVIFVQVENERFVFLLETQSWILLFVLESGGTGEYDVCLFGSYILVVCA